MAGLIGSNKWIEDLNEKIIGQKDTQVDLTVTGTNWTTNRAVGIYYTTTDGAHRLKFNIHGDNSTATNPLDIYITGVVFKNGTHQSISGADGNNLPTTATVYSNTNNIHITHDTATLSAFLSGDVELDSKPTWA